MNDNEDLHRRLDLADRICALLGRVGAPKGVTDAEKALRRAWGDWYRAGGAKVDPPSDADVLELAAREDIMGNVTLMRIRQQQSGDDSTP